jgi:hypothetical protein
VNPSAHNKDHPAQPLPTPAVAGDGVLPHSQAFPAPLPPPPRLRRIARFAVPAFLAFCLAVAATAWHRGQQSRIIIVNECKDHLPALSLFVGGQSFTVPPLDPEASYRWVLPANTAPAPVSLRTPDIPDSPSWNWESPPIPPNSGSRIILHLWDDGSVDVSSNRSVWAVLSGE